MMTDEQWRALENRQAETGKRLAELARKVEREARQVRRMGS